MKEEDIPIPAQIIEIIGKHNVADIYEEESEEENSDVEIWLNKSKIYHQRFKSRSSEKQIAFQNYLKTFQKYYLAKQPTKSPREKKSEGESGYDSKDALLPSVKRTTRRRAETPRARSEVLSSNLLEMFSTRSPVKSDTVKDSTAKRKGPLTRSAVKNGRGLENKTSSSEDESESERIPRINISPFVTKDDAIVSNQLTEDSVKNREHSASENDSDISDVNEVPEHQQPPNPNIKNSSDQSYDVNEVPEHQQPPNPNIKNSSDQSYSSSKSSGDESDKSSCPNVKKGDRNESDTGDSDANPTSQDSLRQANVTSGNKSSCSDSDDSEHEIIPATQDISQKSTNLSLSAISTRVDQSSSDSEEDMLVVDSKTTKLRSPLNSPERKNQSPQDLARPSKQGEDEADKIVQSSSSSKSQPITKSSEESNTSKSSDSDDSRVIPEALFTNVSSASNRPQRAGSSSDDSDSSDVDCSSKHKKVISPRESVSRSRLHSSDSDNADDENKPEPNPPTTKPAEMGHSPSSTTLKVEANVQPNHSSSDSRSSSESDDSDQEAATNVKSSLSPAENQAILTHKKEYIENCSSDSSDSTDDQLRQRTTVQPPISLSNKSRKRKADSGSSSSESENEPKHKVRKTIGTTDIVPFNSTRNPEVEEASFPGGDISVISKTNEPSTTVHQASNTKHNREIPMSLSPKTPTDTTAKSHRSQLARPSQLSIVEFVKPGNPVSEMSSQNKYEALKQEYFDAGFSNLKEQYDFESYEGLLEDDLLDSDTEVYVVQCPKEVDPISLVGHEIDLFKNESVVELVVTGGKTVRHDVYCDVGDSDFTLNVVVPSRTKNKFTLGAVPVSGRLTIVESIDVPQIDELDSSSPPHVPFPENLKARNTFVESGESTAQSILDKSNKGKSRQGRKSDYQEMASFILERYEIPNYEPDCKDETSGEKLKNNDGPVNSSKKKKAKKTQKDTVDLSECDEPSVADPLQPLKTENLEISRKKLRKKKHEECQQDVFDSAANLKKELSASPPDVPVGGNMVKKKKKKHDLEWPDGAGASEIHAPRKTETSPPPYDVPVEELIVKRRKKKKEREMEEPNDPAETQESVKEENPYPSIGDPVTAEPVKKKKKKKREWEELNGLTETIPTNQEILPPSIEELKKKKRHSDEHSIDVPVTEEPVKKKKKKKNRELEDLNGSVEKQMTVKEEMLTPPINVPVTEEPVKKNKKKKNRELEDLNDELHKKKKKKRHTEEHSIDVINSDQNVSSKKKKKKKKKEYEVDD